MDQGINDSKSRIWNPFFSKYFFGFGLFFLFSSRKLQSQQKIAKKATHSTIQFRWNNLTHFKNLKSLDIENNMLSQRSQKPFTLKICTASFLDAQELHSWSTLKANVCIFLYISVTKFLFQRRSKILSGLARQDDFLKGSSLFEPRKMCYNCSF